MMYAIPQICKFKFNLKCYFFSTHTKFSYFFLLVSVEIEFACL